LDWEAGKKTTSRDGRLLCHIALFQGRKIGAHFGASMITESNTALARFTSNQQSTPP
jgi:hypothetical protein